jgi:hypothetical protein
VNSELPSARGLHAARRFAQLRSDDGGVALHDLVAPAILLVRGERSYLRSPQSRQQVRRYPQPAGNRQLHEAVGRLREHVLSVRAGFLLCVLPLLVKLSFELFRLIFAAKLRQFFDLLPHGVDMSFEFIVLPLGTHPILAFSFIAFPLNFLAFSFSTFSFNVTWPFTSTVLMPFATFVPVSFFATIAVTIFFAAFSLLPFVIGRPVIRFFICQRE